MQHYNDIKKRKRLDADGSCRKLGISAQSISKWECGIGYPDVTLFPMIAKLFTIPIGVLFGEKSKMCVMTQENKCVKEFALCKNITVYLGNICRVEYIENNDSTCIVKAEGDPVFIRYFDAEQTGDELIVQIKNPSGSAILWEPYDREGYTNENIVHIYLGEKCVNYTNINYLDLQANFSQNEQTGNYEVNTVRITNNV